MRDVRRRLRLLAALLATLLAGADVAMAQGVTTTVQDTIYSANGTPASGTVLVSWSAFTTAGGSAVPAGSTSVTIGAGGLLTIALAPNAGATPMGSYYTAVLHLNDGTTSRQYWVVPVTVPGGGPAHLAAIQNQVLPTSVAMQTVSKQYVDTAIAAANTGAVAITGGSINNVVINGAVIGGTAPAAGTFTQLMTTGSGGITSAANVAGNLGYSIHNANSGGVGGVFMQNDGLLSGGLYINGSAVSLGAGPNALTYYNDAGLMAFQPTGNLLFRQGPYPGTTLNILYADGCLAMGADQSTDCGAGNILSPQITTTANGGFQETLYTPASSTASCTAGQFTDDANYHYVCTATNTWKRAALSSF